MVSISRRQMLAGSLGLSAGLVLDGPGAAGAATTTTATALPLTASYPAASAASWVQTCYDLVTAENLAPPLAARVYAYLSVAMYEAVRGGIPTASALRGQLNGLTAVPPVAPKGRIDWPTALGTAAAGVLAAVLPFRSATSRPLLDQALADALAGRRAAGVVEAGISAGTLHGKAVATYLNTWIAADGYSGTVGLSYLPPVGAGLWEPTPAAFRPAVEPFWSRVRPLVLRSADEVAPAGPVAFDPDPSSAFGQQAMATYRQSLDNTAEQRAIAIFWADGPGPAAAPLTATGLPSGHWMQIASKAVTGRGGSLVTAVETFARVGISLHDAFVNCWTWKYRHNLLRPVTYLRRYVDPTWTPLLGTPAFPEYSSGHSVGSGAAAFALTGLFGSSPFVDDSPTARGLPARSFADFTAAAREAADSRLYGGIHYPMAIDDGLLQGQAVGRLVQTRLRLV